MHLHAPSHAKLSNRKLFVHVNGDCSLRRQCGQFGDYSRQCGQGFRLCRFKSDRDEIWQDFCTAIDGVLFSI